MGSSTAESWRTLFRGLWYVAQGPQRPEWPRASHTSKGGSAPIPTLRVRYVETHSQKSACVARLKPAGSGSANEDPVVNPQLASCPWVSKDQGRQDP